MLNTTLEDSFLKGSWKGVPFDVVRASTKGGRRLVVHEFPRSEESESEDLGNLTKRFTLNLFLIGNDYPNQVKKFEKVLDEGGEGLLIHPYRGTFIAKVDGSYDAVESIAEGRMIRYTVTFVVDKSITPLQVLPSTPYILSLSSSNALSAIKNSFMNIFTLARQPAKALRDARNALDKGLYAIEAAKRIVASIDEFKREVGNLKGKFQAVMLNLEYITDSFVDLLSWGKDESTNTKQRFMELKQIELFKDTLISGTAVTASFDYPSKQIQNLISHCATVTRIEMLDKLDFTSSTEIEDVKNDLTNSVNNILNTEGLQDTVYEALRDCKVAYINYIEGLVSKVPENYIFQLEETTNSLSLVYNQYGNVDNEQRFLDRNEISHPGFIPAGVDLSLLIE